MFFGITFLIGFLIARPLVVRWNESENERQDSRQKQKELAEKQGKLNHLTQEEKKVLAPFIAGDFKARWIYRYDAVAQGLEIEGVLYAPDMPIDVNSRRAYNLHGWAREYLKENPKLLE